MKIYLTLATLSMALLCFGQTVTEQNLLGKWHIKAVGTENYFADVETDSVSITGYQGISEKDKKEWLENLKTELNSSYVLFAPKLKVEYKFGASLSSFDNITLVERDGRQYAVDKEGREGLIYMKNGLLYFHLPYPKTNKPNGRYLILRKKTD